jgi:arylsulfatase A-like enzyme
LLARSTKASRKPNLTKHTIVSLTSDHGDMMSGHGLLGKQLMFEQSAAVPYLIRMPGERPRRCSQPISHIDFVPTMFDLLGEAASRAVRRAKQSELGSRWGSSARFRFSPVVSG